MSHNQFFGNYRGEVIRVDDPLQAGRIKVNIFSIYDGLTEDEIPWALYVDPLMGGQTNIGSVVIPNVGSTVWCFFEGGDQHCPVYVYGAPAMEDEKTPHLPEESRAEGVEYGQNKVFKTKSGFIFEIDDTEGDTRLRIKHVSGNEQLSDHQGNFDENIEGNETRLVKGNEEETIKGTETRTVEGNVDETLNGTLTIDVASDVIIRAPNLQLGEDAAVQQSLLGKAMEDWINNELIPWINAHTHTSPGNGNPTSPPLAPFSPGTAAPGGAVYSKVQTNS